MKTRIGLALVGLLLISSHSARAQSGPETFKSKCAMCHAADGTASGPMGKNMSIPSFKSAALIKASDADLFAATKNGKGKMPPYAAKLTDPQIKGVVAYIRTLQK